MLLVFWQGAFLEKIKSENPGIPCFLFGHSTGGAVVLKVSLKSSAYVMLLNLSLSLLNFWILISTFYCVGGISPSYWRDGGRNYINLTGFASEASSPNCWCKFCICKVVLDVLTFNCFYFVASVVSNRIYFLSSIDYVFHTFFLLAC